MREVRSRHWLCETEVVERVDDDYDLADGLALVCPVCKDVWWHYPEADAIAQVVTGSDARLDSAPVAPDWDQPEPEPLEPAPVEPAPEVGAGPAEIPDQPMRRARAGKDVPPGELWDESFARMGWDEGRPRRARPRGPAPAQGEGPNLVRGWLAPALIVGGLALIIIQLADPGPRRGPAGRPASTAAASFTVILPRGWVALRREGATVVAPSRGAPISLYVYAKRQPGLTLRHMAELTGRRLRAALGGARLQGPRPVRIGRLRGLRLQAARGTVAREDIALESGPWRYLLEVRRRAGATATQRAQAAEAVASFQPR